MLAQHWATSRCRRPSVDGDPIPPIIAFPDQLPAAAIDATRWLLCSCRLRYVVIWGSFVDMVWSFFYVFVFYSGSVGL